MSFGRPSPEGTPRIGEGANKLRAVQEQTHKKLDNMRETVTLGQWVTGARKRMVDSGALKLAEQAEQSTSRLPENTQSEWQRNMGEIKRLATREMRDRNGLTGTGDPIAMLMFIRGILPQLETLKGLAATSGDGNFIGAVQNIENTCTAYVNAIGPMHQSQASFFNQNMQPWSPGRTREGQMLQGAVAIAAGAAAIGTGILAFFAKDDEANWTLPMGYGVAAFLAGYGDNIGRTGTQNLDRQVVFMRSADMQAIRKQYNISGSDWGAFVRRYYDARSNSESPIMAFLNNRNQRDANVLKSQRSAILAMAPASIQNDVQDMLNSGGGTRTGLDFRNFASQLNNATSRFAQGAVINEITGAQPRRVPPGTGIA